MNYKGTCGNVFTYSHILRFPQVQLSTSGAYSQPNGSLWIAKCHQLANYYLGFNGWTVEMKKWDKQTNEKEEVIYRCEAVLKVRAWGIECEGVGEETVVMEEGRSKSSAIGIAQKRSYQKACESAFSQLVLVVLPNGKMFVHSLAQRHTEIKFEGPPVNVTVNEYEFNDGDESQSTKL